ncbi:hypothetical protein NW762_008278 [Fusarium torreyae]|uniref:Uncharacterized protein n=1 Tax=Fusarium torreyae TaxID=1237075 RepID=A0A9W8RZJ1_9HYPO|nr:hypothetical protein NW762_008278 [Fusarium torreyae]
MDVTASTINRTSPLDLDFAKISPFFRPGSGFETIDTTAHLPSDSHQPSQAVADDRTALRFSSNAAIIEQYSKSWNNSEPQGDLVRSNNTGFEQLIGPTAGHTPRWPFINDDSLNTPDSLEAEPLFPTSRSAVNEPRQCHRIDEDLEDLAALYVQPLDAVPEVTEVEALPPPPPSRRTRGKVMTTAEFEALQKRKAREDAEKRFYEGEDEEDKFDYDCVDEADALKSQRIQRKKQQAHLDGYRQQMMKITKGPELPAYNSHSRVSSSWSMKSFKTFHGHPEETPEQYDNEDNDEDNVPLALLQIQRRSGGRDIPSRLAGGKPDSFPHLQSQPQPTTSLRRQNSRSPLPAFARKLPHDPFPGNVSNAWPLNNQQLVPGGLVGVIAIEERAKAMRRVVPSHGFQPMPDTNNAFNWTGAPYQQATMPSSYAMPGMQPPMPYSRPQTPVALPQLAPAPPADHMFNFLQAQTEFLRTMASMNHQRTNQSWDAFSSQQSVLNVGIPGAGSTYAPSNYAMSTYQQPVGYAPSVAPSERNNVGLPSRYRPVSKAASQPRSEKQSRSNDTETIKDWGGNGIKGLGASFTLPEDSTDDDDDEAFWRAKKAKRDRRRAVWIQENDLGVKPEWIV